MLGAFLARTPFSLLFGLTGVLCLSASFFVRATCPEEKVSHPVAARTERSFFSVLCAHRIFAVMMVVSLLLFLMTSQLYSTLSIYAKNNIGLTSNQLGMMYAANGLTVIVLQLPVNRMIERLRLSLCLVIGATVYTLGYASLGWASSFGLAVLSVILISSGEVLTLPTFSTWISRVAPAHMLGRYMGAFSTVRGVGYSIGPYIGALLYPQLSGEPVQFWLLLASFGLVATGGFLCLHLRGAREKRDDA